MSVGGKSVTWGERFLERGPHSLKIVGDATKPFLFASESEPLFVTRGHGRVGVCVPAPTPADDQGVMRVCAHRTVNER